MTQTAASVSTEKSTIVRTPRAAWPTRAAFAVLERIVPAVGGRWAQRLWFTLPPRHAPSRQSSGALFAATVDGHEVVGEAWGDGPPIYLVHGWAGHRGQFADFVEPLLARRLRVIAFDMPSHGDSAPGALGPRSSSFPEFTAALRGVVARFGHPRAIVAHSAGAVAAAGALCDGMPADRLVLLAPMASPTSQARRFAAALGLGARGFAHMVTRIERRVGAPMRHFDLPELGRAVAMPPTLVIHDRDDRSTSVADGAAIAAAWPQARLTVTTGLGHNRLLRSPAVIANVVDFVAG
ncbi:MAG TPA: alpha/beta fold hydrolase [Micromonosporaceae bacterium]|jgi:pimeloyl-ACP methyl ester carboxylesterase